MFRLDSGAIKPTGSKVRCSKCGQIFKAFRPNEDETGKMITHGLGIAMDVSKGGVLLETTIHIKPGLIVLAATDRQKNLIEVKGKIAYSKKSSTGTYLTGIEFTGVNERVTQFITKLIKEYNWQGYNLFYRWHNPDPASKDGMHPSTSRP